MADGEEVAGGSGSRVEDVDRQRCRITGGIAITDGYSQCVLANEGLGSRRECQQAFRCQDGCSILGLIDNNEGQNVLIRVVSQR